MQLLSIAGRRFVKWALFGMLLPVTNPIFLSQALAQEETTIQEDEPITEAPIDSKTPVPAAQKAPPRSKVVAQDMPSVGPASAEMQVFDILLPQFLEKWDIPGASVAIVRDEKLVFARSYGLANVESGEQMQPQSRLRIASISKTITATAILQLAEAGQLTLDTPILGFLKGLQPFPGQKMDPRFARITLQHLLQHTGGWERHVSPEVSRSDLKIARETGAKLPLPRDTVIRYMLGQPVQHDPGTRYSYCNFGYMLLGKVIEEVSGEPYESYVRTHVLEPSGARFMRLGRTLEKDRAPGEAHYYPDQRIPLLRSVFDPQVRVPPPYGSYLVENSGSGGGWIASSVDLARFLTAIDGQPRRPDLLSAATQEIRNAPPQLLAETPGELKNWYYADGFFATPGRRNVEYWNGGSNYGVASLMRWSADGLGWVVLLNGRSNIQGFDADIKRMMLQGVRTIKRWPQVDLFEHYTPDYKE